MTIALRPVRDSDLSALVRLNNSAHPAVPNSDDEELRALVGVCSLALVAEQAGSVVGFLLAIDPEVEYASENYRYFSERATAGGTSFLYIDRIVIGESARGAGLGRRLYEEVFARAAADGRDEVTCEVNIEPPNPQSLAFHSRMGFERIGEQATKGGAVVVALLAAPARQEALRR